VIRRTIAVIALLAFTNYIFGCYSKELISASDVRLTKETIVQLVLRDGNIVTFSGAGGKYVVKEPGLIGKTNDGEPSFCPLSRIVCIYSSKAMPATKDELAGRRIVEALYSKTRVAFDMNGGKLDSNQQALVGTDAAGQGIFLPIAETKEIYVNDVSPVSKEEYLQNPNRFVAEILTTSGRVTDIDTVGMKYINIGGRNVIAGITATGDTVEVDVDNILSAEVRKIDAPMTALAVFVGIPLIAGGILLIALLVNPPKSCPFVYAYDGKQYHFDAEPLGGAICPGLKRTDVSRLKHLKPTNGNYNILVRNELDETQHLDEMKLLVVDHSGDQTVLPDVAGNLYAVKNIRNATSATDENGADLMKFFEASDRAAWQTHMPTASSLTHFPLRHHLTITLPKPKGAREAHIVHNVGTAAWGSIMITKMLEYHGNNVDDWLTSLQPGSESYKQLYSFLEREETYYLKLMVKKGDTWVHRGTIRGQGPLVPEDRVTTIDVSDLPGDSLVVQLNPPMGFWAIDYIGVSYEAAEKVHPTEISPRWSENNDGVSITDLINSIDDQYYSMPNVGDWTKLSFTATPIAGNGMIRTIFLKTTGYYEQHLNKEQPEQIALLKQIMESPGFIIKIAMEEFVKWRAEQLARK